LTSHIQLRHKKVVEGAIVLLALLVLALSVSFSWQSYSDYRTDALAAKNSELAYLLADAMERYTLERGLTAAVLGAKGKPADSFRTQIAEARRQADSDWQKAMALAATLANGPDFDMARTLAGEARERLDGIRRRVEAHLDGRGPPVTLNEWFETSTQFIAVSGRVWETALFAERMTQTEAGRFAMPRKILWEASEQAGQERGLLAYYINARAPVPDDMLERLRFTRDMTAFGIERAQRLLDTPSMDPRVASAVAAMQRKYLDEFAPVRAQVYRATRSGGYPLSATEWLAQASAAIQSIHAVNEAITAVAVEKSVKSEQRHLSWLGFTLLLLTGSAGLSVASLTRVRSMVEGVFHQKELAEVTMDSIGDAVITTDAEGRVEYLNPVAEGLTGWTTDEAKGRPLTEIFNIVNGYNRESKENPIERCLRENRVVGLGNDTVLIRRDGSESVIEDSAAPVRDRGGKVVGAVMVFYDVAAQRGNTHLMSYHATHDRLTGLVNRAEFERRLMGVLEQTKSRGGQHALCYLDLDQFKLVNDTCGHAAGDQLLRQLTKQLQTRVRDTDTLSHLGSDEFGLLLVSCPLDKAIAVAEDLLRLVHDFRFEWRGSAFNLGASVGVVPITPENDNAGEVLAKADSACFAAKEKGRNRIQVYEPGDLEYAHRHGEMQWVARLNQALAQDRLRLYCQPIVPLRAHYPAHYEILLRLADEHGQIVLPGEFLPAAERYNLISQIDRWVVRHTLSTLKQVLPPKPARRAGVACNINLSGASIGEASFLDELGAELEAAALPPGAVCFEITETAAVSNLEQATKLIRMLKSRGCTLALDDFGTGLCSFSYLRDMQVDFLKIGGQFVKEIARDPTARAAVQAINTVGHTLHMRTVAEHVSSPKILEHVRAIGVDYAQGFTLGKPMPVEECMLKHYRPAASAARAKTAPAGRRPKAG
jgi:diguanylate cyclase (GGDEF)-like protein/PAS domain S-box-containing protein